MSKVFSPGKLLLTSEYFVLDGALALAVPTQLGQEFFYEENKDGNSRVFWEAYHKNELWLKVEIDYRNWDILETNNRPAAEFVVKVLKNVQELSENQFNSDTTYHLKTNLQFPADYGLGSSSTLMNNLAVWASIDPFLLNEKSLGGSGYDIAVATEASAILYRNLPEREIRKIVLSPEFKAEIVFIHLKQKQDSRDGINLYKSKPRNQNLIDEFSAITEAVSNCEDLVEFSDLMTKHEQLVSTHLGIPTVKEKLFSDYPGFVKSLGAWGGDFVMASKTHGFREYFSGLGFGDIYEWDALILS